MSLGKRSEFTISRVKQSIAIFVRLLFRVITRNVYFGKIPIKSSTIRTRRVVRTAHANEYEEVNYELYDRMFDER